MLTKREIDTTILERKKTCVNVPSTKNILTSVDHTFLTNNEKLDYLIGELYIKVEVKINNVFYFLIIYRTAKIKYKEGKCYSYKNK